MLKQLKDQEVQIKIKENRLYHHLIKEDWATKKHQLKILFLAQEERKNKEYGDGKGTIYCYHNRKVLKFQNLNWLMIR